ncbi:MAG: restriction endonuclease [Nitrospinae bacterium]|nr:restriction endonuclease [Nitrospinota bacterium]
MGERVQIIDWSIPVAIPDFQQCFLPLLRFLADGLPHTGKEAVESLSNQFRLSDEERAILLPSGRQAIMTNRVQWAKTYLKKAGFIFQPERAVIQITDAGRRLLASDPVELRVRDLRSIPEFAEWHAVKTDDDDAREQDEELALESKTPEELLDSGYKALRQTLVSDILAEITKNSPAFFERLVVNLLQAMGYGAAGEKTGFATGKSGDEGIDGVISEDKLGLDQIYIQAKRWEGTVVGRPEIQKFVGALQGQRAKKGVFITTSTFSSEARDYAAKIDTRVILIDGQRLANLMFDHNVGVALKESYEIKKLDSDYFIEE